MKEGTTKFTAALSDVSFRSMYMSALNKVVQLKLLVQFEV